MTAASITPTFCRSGRTTPLTSAEGPPLFERLRANGFLPVPLSAKTKKTVDYAWPLLASEGTLRWSQSNPGIGLLCGRSELDPDAPPTPNRPRPWRNTTPAGGLLALDFDLNKRASKDAPMTLTPEEQGQAFEAIARCPTLRRLLQNGALARQRGGSSNFVLALCNDGSIGNGKWPFARDGKPAIEIELLASGRQFASFAVHPDGGAYTWHGDRSPETTRLASLPTLDAGGLTALHAEVVEALRPLGLGEASPARPQRVNGKAIAPGKTVDALCASAPPFYTGDEVKRLCAALACVPADDRDDWLDAGFALKWLSGRGWPEATCRAIFDAWSATTTKDNFDLGGQEKQWRSASDQPGGITVGTIFHLAKEHGWTGLCAAPAWAAPIVAGLQAPDPDPSAAPASGARESAAPPTGAKEGLSWPMRGKRGPFNDERNVAAALAHLGVSVHFDAFRLTYHINGLEGFAAGAELTDDAARELRACFESLGLRLQRSSVFEHVLAIGRRDARHPVHDYFDALRWDGAPRLDGWLSTYFGASSTPFARAAGALPLIAAVRRIRRRGAKFDTMLVLEGEQGVGKSMGLRALTPRDEWFTDDFELGADARETIEQTRGKLIVEISELNGLGRREAERVKAQLSRTHDRARLAYDRAVSEVARQFVLIGSTNSAGYLSDLTGNRRFWPVRVERVDVAGLRRDRDQLWAEAAAREAAGASIALPPELWAAAAAAQEERLHVPPVVEELTRQLEGVEGVLPSAEIYKALGLLCADKPSFYHEAGKHGRDIHAALARLGWSKCRPRDGGGSGRVCAYVKGRTWRRLRWDGLKLIDDPSGQVVDLSAERERRDR